MPGNITRVHLEPGRSKVPWIKIDKLDSPYWRLGFRGGRLRIVRRFQHGLAILANQTIPGHGVGRPAGSGRRSPDSFIAGKSDGWMSTAHSGDIGSRLLRCLNAPV